MNRNNGKFGLLVMGVEAPIIFDGETGDEKAC